MFLITSCVSAPDTVVSPAPTNTEVVVATPPNLGVSIDQPEWMKDPNSDILLLSYGVNAVFFDAGTASTLYMALPNARWVDNNHVLFTAFDQAYSNISEKTYKYALDIADWKIVEAKYISDIVDKDGNTPNVFVDKDEENTPLKIYNKQLQQWEVLLYPPQGLYNLYEIDVDNKIFVVQGGDAYGSGYVIAVYNYETKQILRTFVGKVEMNVLRYSEGKVVYITENIPCAIDVQTLERECGLPIPEKYENIAIGRTLVYPEIIPFTYEEHVDKYAYTTKMCLFSFFTGKIICPMEDLQILKPVTSTVKDWKDPSKQMEIIQSKFVGSYSISPDGKYVVFCYLDNYFARYEGTAIIGVNGSDFHILDEVEFVPDFISNICTSGTVPIDFKWRPLPQR